MGIISNPNLSLPLSILLLLFSGSAWPATDQEIVFCGEDLSDKNNFYRFENFRNNIALMPNDGSNISAYEAIFNIYEYRLNSQDKRTDTDSDFLLLLEEIVAGLTTANLSLDSSEDNLMGVYAGGQLAFPINCDLLNENRATYRNIGYILTSIKKIYQDGWSTLSKDIHKTTKLRSVRYDQWMKNGVQRIIPETLLYKTLGLDGRLQIDPSKSRSQYTFLRPHLGLGASDTNSTYKLTVAIDLFGVINYTNVNYSSHWGLSLAVIARENESSGIGILFRRNDYLFGITHNADDNSDGVFIGIDFFQLLEGKRSNDINIRIEEASSSPY